MKRVVVGLSGGVDSGVAAYLLQQQGYEVLGVFMKNWHDDSVTISKECPWLDDSNDAMIVADSLEIPFQTVDLSSDYKRRIVDYMFREYKRGRTPNPDVLCNREIKFDVFLKIALDLGADYVATGHYCRKERIKKGGQIFYRLLAGKDLNKDQSYFLCQLNQQQLEKSLFPLGELTKKQVRAIAVSRDLTNADKKDSQGLCFVGKVKLPEFLQQHITPRKGYIIEIPCDHLNYDTAKVSFESLDSELESLSKPFVYKISDGKNIGVHNGAHYFTIGQRKGLDVGGKNEPLFVLATDTNENTVFVGQGKNHPGLYRKALFIKDKDIHWIQPYLSLKPNETRDVLVRIRYRQPLQKAYLYRSKKGLYIRFNSPQSAITSGQFAVWYTGDELIGSGVIA